MNVSSRLDAYFTRNSRARGEQYYLQRRVQIEEGSDRELFAQIRGSSMYDVSLTFNDDILTVWCGCPYFGTHGTHCKHLWAALLAADQLGHLSAVASAKTVRMVSDYEDNGGDYDESEVDDRAATGSTAPRVHGSADNSPASRQPSWRQRVSALGAAATPGYSSPPSWPANREILYLIDLAASRTRGALFLTLQTHDRKPDGTCVRHNLLAIERRQIATLPIAEDREILSVLAGSDAYAYNYYERLPNTFSMPASLSAMVVPKMVHTGRCLMQQPANQGGTLSMDESGPWGFELELSRLGEGQYRMDGLFRRGEQRMNVADPVLIVPGFLFMQRVVAPLAEDARMRWILELRKGGPIIVAEKERDSFLAALLGSSDLPPLTVPDEMHYEEVEARIRPHIRIFSARWNGHPERLRAELSFSYDQQLVSEFDTAPGFFDTESRRFMRRNVPAEKAAGDLLERLGARLLDRGYARGEATREISSRKLPGIVRSLLEAGWHVEAENKVFRRPGSTRLEVSSGVDWFELHGAIQYGETSARLPELLAAVRRGEDMVLLDDGSYGMVPEEWLRRIAPLAGMGNPEDGHIRFGRGQAGLLDAMLAVHPEASFDETFAAVRDELKAFAGVTPGEQPEGFVGHLREYQNEGLGWMHFLRRFRFGGCLADDMGVGKTAQVLALLETRRELRAAGEPVNPSLVVVPRSLIFNWKEEAARFTPQIRVLDHSGLGRHGVDLAEFDLVLTTYGTLRRDIPKLKDFEFDYLVLDESQTVKNANTQASKAVRLLRGSYRLALSGTPIENHLGELWSLFEFLNPGMLGTASAFTATGGAMRAPDDETLRMMRQALRPFILRRTKEQVARELPARTDQTVYCEMEAGERKRYEELRQHYRSSLLERIESEGIAKSKIHVLEALLRLRQAACHPGLLDAGKSGEPSAKLEMLLGQLTEVIEEGHKALVFSQFTSLLKIVRDRLDRRAVVYEYLDGATRDRQARVERFQNDEDCRAFLISLKAGGLGLNLTAAEYVFILDPWWNPAAEAQAVDRAHRIGQSRPVFAYRLITRGTVEERVLDLQNSKRDLAASIITADNSLIRNLRAEDLSVLLS